MITPKLRFSEFKDEWNKKKLGEVAQFLQGEQVDLELQKSNSEIDLIKFLRIENFTQLSSDFRYVKYNGNPEKILKTDDIAIVRYGATAGFICSGIEGLIANNIFKVVLNESLNKKFTLIQLKSDKVFNYLQSEMSGGAMPALNFKIAGNIDISFPKIEEQTKIAEFLSAVDDKISQLSRQLELLNQYKKGVMQKIFSQEIRFKNENGEDFGEWEYIKLSKIASIQGGFAFKSDYFGSGINKVIKIGDVTGRMYLKNFKGSTSSELPEERYQVSINSVLIALSGATFGKLGLILDNEKAFINQRVAKIYPTQNNINLFIYFLMQTNEFYNYIQSIPSASAQPNISNQDVLNYEFYCPQFEEQQKIAEFLTAIDERIDHTTAQLTHTKQWKKGLLQQMFV
nr:restriction endonuclease subunit S [Moraxella sp. CTOTU48268]